MKKKSEHEDPSGHSLEKDLLLTFFSNLAQKDGVDVPVFARYSKCFFQVTCKIFKTSPNVKTSHHTAKSMNLIKP